jgi:hypothetical protein
MPPATLHRKAILAAAVAGAGVSRTHTSSLLLAVALLRLVVVPSLSLARPLRETHHTCAELP